MPRAHAPRLALAALVALCACQDQPAERPEGPVEDSAPRVTVLGEWRWVLSESGSSVVRPTSPADSTTIEVQPFGRYRERRGGAELTSNYALAEGRRYQTADSSYTVLMLDSSGFFPRSGDRPPAIAVRAASGDTLLLSGTGSDSTFYTFVRAPER